jgi:hypothetical protein
MPIRTAAEIHRLRTDGHAAPVASLADYRRAHAQAIHALGLLPTLSDEVPDVYVEAWKWCVVCATADCDNRPAYGWGTACCFDCGAIYQGLTLPDDAAAITSLLELRPKLSQRGWLTTETLDDLAAQNAMLGVGP